VSAQLPNWREFVSINLACCALGLVFNPIIPIYRGAELGFILKDAGTRVLFIPEQYRGLNYVETIHALRGSLPALEHVIAVRPTSSASALKELGASALETFLVAGTVKQPAYPEVSPDHVKLLMYTSGTTGQPKGVLHTHNTLTRVVDNIMALRQLGPADVMFMASPVTHVTGYSACEMPLVTEVKAAIMERWDKARAVDFIERTRSTFSVGATPFLHELVQECTQRGSRLPTMKHFACGGAAVPPELIRQAHRVFDRCRCFRVYGSTEVPLVSQGVTERHLEEFAATTDGRIFNYEVRVVGAEGAVLGHGQEGELLARGPAMMVGYTDAESTRTSLTDDGFFLTGDLGYVTEAGDVVITGRKKDLIIRGGENISAKEIEDVLHTHELIQEAAVVSMPHPRLGEGIAAYIKLSDATRPVSLGDVAAHIENNGLARQKTPERIEIIEEFPRTASGKIRKDLLRQDIRKKLAGTGG
jgi:acyl-CoA synthetase